jgi:hypothetical protein
VSTGTPGTGQPTTSGTPGTGESTTSGTPGTGQPTTSGTLGTGQPTTSGTQGTGQPTTSGTPGTGQPTTSGTPGTGQPTTSGTPGSSQSTTSGTPGSGQSTTSGTPGTGQPTTSGTPGTGQSTTSVTSGTGQSTASGTQGTGQPTTSGTPGTTTTGKYCDEMEFIDSLIATDSIETQPKDISDKEDLIKKGVDFTDNKPSFVIDLPNGGAIVRDIQVPSKNVAEIEVTFTTTSGQETTPIRGSPTSLPTDKFPTEKVVEIVVKVTKTTDDESPKDVTLSVIACAEGTVTTTTTGNTFIDLKPLTNQDIDMCRYNIIYWNHFPSSNHRNTKYWSTNNIWYPRYWSTNYN